MELVKSVSIENMVNQRAAVVARLNQALDLIAEAEALAAAANVGFPRLVIDNHYATRGRTLTLSGQYASRDDDARVAMLRTVDGPAWQYLMKESGLRTFMDAEARSKWDNQIHEGDVPELTAENVRATLARSTGRGARCSSVEFWSASVACPGTTRRTSRSSSASASS